MPAGPKGWWNDDRVDETVTPAYVHSHLRANEQEILERSVYFGGDLTDNTYLDWIILRAKRLFLILVDAGVPDQIFGVVDDAFEDDDLPIAQHVVPSLRLSIEADPVLDKRFYRAQFKYLSRVLQDGEHIRYADEESVPLTVAAIKPSTLLSRDTTDTVRLPEGSSDVFVRKRIALNATISEIAILGEIAELKRFSHEHVLSVYASYVQGDDFYILSNPAGEYSLKSLLMDQPKAFDALSKPDRRKRMMNWIHCLANAVAWLHYNGGHHGAIKPSNIHITQGFGVCLGSMDGEGVLCLATKAEDIESYQYAPPERWKRSITFSSTGQGKLALPSGNRSGRKVQKDDDINDPSMRCRSGSTMGHYSDKDGTYTFQPASKSEFSRLRLSNADPSARRQSTQTARRTRGDDGDDDDESLSSFGQSRRQPAQRGSSAKPPSLVSSNSSEGRSRAYSDGRRGIFVSAPESRTAVVQTWKSVQHDSFAADIFSLGAVVMDILTVLCKRTYSAFARHRSKNNRNAGRGGGLADASFHANPSQVISWAQILCDDAEKKIKQDESRVLSAVGAVLQIVVQCFEKDPNIRPKSDVFERKIKDHITKFTSIDTLHCISKVPDPLSEDALRRRQQLNERNISKQTSGRIERLPPRIYRSRTPIPELDETATVALPSPQIDYADRPATSRTITRPISPPAVSLDSFSSLHIDHEIESIRSDTVVARSRDHSYYSPKSDRSKDSQRPIRILQPPQPLYSEMDSGSSDERIMTTHEPGMLTYMDYSTSPSDDERDRSKYYYPMPPPPQPPPQKHLPAVPGNRGATQHPPSRPPRPGDHHISRQHQRTERPFPQTAQVNSLHADIGFYDDRDHPHQYPPRRESSLARDEPRPTTKDSRRPRVIPTIAHDEVEREKKLQQLAAATRRRDYASTTRQNPIAKHIAEQDRLYQHRI